ncbi:DUF21 domain-containing protein At5g52790-like [Camellia sinensis]|uniref:DUF21 domain-containing protein At5g52790-like n=1 Tax=Camellia sinensis TaxID=4442 RepID=UPI001036DAA2|nr:DUF21 domain-containing protein At5g52790-like [Camellia sinensis]
MSSSSISAFSGSRMLQAEVFYVRPGSRAAGVSPSGSPPPKTEEVKKELTTTSADSQAQKLLCRKLQNCRVALFGICLLGNLFWHGVWIVVDVMYAATNADSQAFSCNFALLLGKTGTMTMLYKLCTVKVNKERAVKALYYCYLFWEVSSRKKRFSRVFMDIVESSDVSIVEFRSLVAGKGGELTHDETTIISGALDLTQKTTKDAMTPLSEIFSIDLNSKLDEDTMSLIMGKGHSRIPVYSGSPSNIIGLILVKNLIKCRAEDETPIRILTIRRIPRVEDSLPLYDILNQFQKGHSHMAAVVKSKHNVKDTAGNATEKNDMIMININSNSSILQKQAEGKFLESLPDQEEEVIGIITMEDVLEELLQEEILDETDEYVDVHNK